MVGHWWAWLVAQGLYRDLVATSLALGLARLLAWRPLRRHHATQERIADLLDTKTEGGLHDVATKLDHIARTQGGKVPDAGPPAHTR